MKSKVQLYLLSIFFGCTYFCFSQSNVSESHFNDVFQQATKFMFSAKDSAYYHFKKAIDIGEKLNDKENVLEAYDYLIYTAGYHYDLAAYKLFLKGYESVTANITNVDGIPDVTFYTDRVLILKGNHYFKLGEFTKAKIYFKSLRLNLSELDVMMMKDHQIETYLSVLNFLALIYVNQQQLNLAKSYFEELIETCEKYKSRISYWPQTLYNNKKLLAVVFKKQGKHGAAIDLLEECIEYYQLNFTERYKNALITSYFELSENYLLSSNVRAALKTIRKVNGYILSDDPFKRHQKTLRAFILTKSKEFEKAITTYHSALKETIDYRNGTKNQDVAEIYFKLGDLERDRNQNEKSLEYYQKALISASNSFDDNSVGSNPSPEVVFSKTQLLTILRNKLEVLNQLKGYNNDQEILQASTNTSKSIVTTLDALRPEFESKLDKQFLIDQTYPAFHSMIQSAYTGYAKTKDPQYLEDAFMYLEKSKSILLLEAVKNAEAITFGTIPDSIMEKELHFRAYITNLEKKLLDADKKSQTTLNDSLFKLNTRYYDFLSDIEKKYPKYYNLKYDTKTTNLKELQQFIMSDETVLSFHQTQENLFAFVTTKSNIKFLKIPFTSTLKSDIEQLYKLHSNPIVTEYGKLRKLGDSIYDRILAPCLKNDTNTELTIITDGLLNYIPFGALTNAKTGNYLIKERNIHYANSTTLIIGAANNKDNPKSNLLAISPTFDTNSEFSPLPFSKQEAGIILGYFRGKTLSGKEASLDNFKTIKDDYSLLHFATHASANDEQPDFSYLAFAKDGNEENRLFVKDLYNYNLNAAMVTLSACESGIGKLQNGEGMLSLARGFQYAGVPSLTTTLWKNDDQSTSELMGYYYKYLNDGLTKSKALQKAKLEYLANTEEEELKHPYYWAGFVVLGDNSPISDKPISPWLLAGLGLLGTGILVFGYKKIKMLRVAA